MIGSDSHVVIVGAGLSGSVLAERYASVGRKVIVIDKRDHIGGNCYDYFDEHGIRISKYGAHLFHTNYEDVYEYIHKFSAWRNHKHKVYASVDDALLPVPVNLRTYQHWFGEDFTEGDLEEFIKYRNPYIGKDINNSEDSALVRIGHKEIYEKMFKNYTKKQWNVYPEDLDASVMERIPVRYDYTEGYFNDKYQLMPENGYTQFFENVLDNKNIELILNTDFDDVEDIRYDKLFFTGPIDQYFRNMFGKLEYRSIRFEHEYLDIDSFQENSVINYPSYEVGFTRIIEHKKIYNQDVKGTVITREYSTDEGDPYYPFPNKKNQDIYKKYQEYSNRFEEDGVYFAGRLASYRYINMDQAIKNALDLFEKLEGDNDAN